MFSDSETGSGEKLHQAEKSTVSELEGSSDNDSDVEGDGERVLLPSVADIGERKYRCATSKTSGEMDGRDDKIHV